MEENKSKFRLRLNLFDGIILVVALAVAAVLLWKMCIRDRDKVSARPLGQQAGQRALCRPYHRRQPGYPGQPDRGGDFPQKDYRGDERRGPGGGDRARGPRQAPAGAFHPSGHGGIRHPGPDRGLDVYKRQSL